MSIVLNEILKPLHKWYSLPWIEEIAVNNTHSVWLRLRNMNPQWVEQKDPKLTTKYFQDLFHIISSFYQLSFNPQSGFPMIYATLPGEHRFSGIIGKNVMFDSKDSKGGVALVIRTATKAGGYDLGSYHVEEGQPLKQINKTEYDLPDDAFRKIQFLIQSGKPIIISGATATGKTSLLNYIISQLKSSMRIITVEDTHELSVPQKNHIHFILSRTQATNKFSYQHLIDLIVRFSPNAIIGSEISMQNASALWSIVNTGHSHFYTTIHAESVQGAYKTLVDRILETSDHYSQLDLLEDVKKKFHVIQLSADGGIRAITAVE
ncbi:MAG: Flp pilus assembly complex ATPase component TadA [Alphaproteobacteria bacterium]|nr:Flp pilus assembly complex ATPase component TadA [Alphaproteobacteria bacterium]MBL0717880.1 Flp pilus assembly complex ATPase component TadA [Alphaproteobacteria bacterium]